MGKKQVIVRRSKALLGLSLPVVETGVFTGAGILSTNFITYQVRKVLAEKQWASGTAFTVAVKVVAGIVQKMLVGKLNRRWANAMLGGALGSATLTVIKRIFPSQYEQIWGLAGGGGDYDVDRLIAEASALNGTFNSSDVYGGRLNGYYDSASILRAAGIGR